MGGRAVANSRIVAGKQGDQRFVLAQWDARKAPDAAIGCPGDAKTCAGDCRVMRPRIVLERIEQPRQFGKQSLVRILQLATPIKEASRCRQACTDSVARVAVEESDRGETP
jgi:hypothetical protein